MHRARIIVAVITMITTMLVPNYGSTSQDDRDEGTIEIKLKGTGIFYNDCAGSTISGIWKFRASAHFTREEDIFTFQEGDVSATLFVIDGRILRHLAFSLDDGLYDPRPGRTGTRVGLRGSFVFPDNNTYSVNIYGVVNGDVGVMLTKLTTGCPD
jgi:hypothetical protein